MNKSVFQYRSYKEFLNDFIKAQPYGGRGIRSQFAKALNMHTAYMSQVLGKYAHFTLEQGKRLASHLGLTKNETHFFILLIQYERAGSKELEEYFLELIEEYAETQQSLKNRLEISGEIKPEDQQRYYSSWYYIAVHALLSIPEFRDPKLISQRLELSREKVDEIIEFLLKTGLIIRSNNSYEMGSQDIHLSQDSPMINTHHTNWRLRAMNSLSNSGTDDLHYSGVISIRKEDANIVKDILIKTLQDIRKVIKTSSSEEVYCYTLDLFTVGNS